MDGADGDVVGVAEPGLVPALRALGHPADAAQARQRDLSAQLPGPQVVDGELADRVPGPRHEQHRRRQLVPVEDGETVEHRLVVLGDEVDPGVVRGLLGARDGDPVARGVAVGHDVQPTVAADVHSGLRVDVLLHDPQAGSLRGRRARAPGDVGEPQVVPRRRALGRGDAQPAPVEADADAVVLGVAPPGPEHQDVLGGVGAQPVQPHPAMELLLALGHQRGVEAPHVVVRRGARQPGDGGVPGAVDGPVDDLTGHHVHDAQHGLLRAALGELVREQVALLGGLPGIQGGQQRRVEARRVEQHPLGAVRVHGHQHRVLLGAVTAHEELPLRAPHGCADAAGCEQLADPAGPVLTAHPAGGLLLDEDRLRRGPLDGARVVDVLQVAVRVGDPMTEQVVHDVDPRRVRIREGGDSGLGHGVTLEPVHGSVVAHGGAEPGRRGGVRSSRRVEALAFPGRRRRSHDTR